MRHHVGGHVHHQRRLRDRVAERLDRDGHDRREHYGAHRHLLGPDRKRQRNQRHLVDCPDLHGGRRHDGAGLLVGKLLPGHRQLRLSTATLRDNTAGTTTTVLPKTCASSVAWAKVSASITAGHSYTLTLSNNDDNYSGDPTYTRYDDVVTS